jgi:hypothetical protein
LLEITKGDQREEVRTARKFVNDEKKKVASGK